LASTASMSGVEVPAASTIPIDAKRLGTCG